MTNDIIKNILSLEKDYKDMTLKALELQNVLQAIKDDLDLAKKSL